MILGIQRNSNILFHKGASPVTPQRGIRQNRTNSLELTAGEEGNGATPWRKFANGWG